MYVGQTRYVPLNIAYIWLAKYPTPIANWENHLEAWFKSWVKENNATVEYAGEKYSAKALCNDTKAQIVFACKEEIEKNYQSESQRKGLWLQKGWLKRYRSSPEYNATLAEKLAANQDYQTLCAENYETSDVFARLVARNEADELQRTLDGITTHVKTKYADASRKEFKEYLDTLELSSMLDKLKLEDLVLSRIERWLSSQRIECVDRCLFSRHFGQLSSDEDIVFAALGLEVNLFLSSHLPKFMNKHETFASYAAKRLKGRNKGIRTRVENDPSLVHVLSKKLENEYHLSKLLKEKVKASFTTDYIIQLLLQNPNYQGEIRNIIRRKEERKRIEKCILERIPERYEDLYPAARQMHRHFVLHFGPTNSGKTYQSMLAFRNANTGVYLAPLRLLAYEAYEESCQLGCPCNMITGEEQLIQDGATHYACTIEMANLRKKYDVCVIDEAQMLSDRERGGAWTAAILGVQANEVHVCAAPSARDMIVKLIELCHDTYEIVEHERFVPLVFEEDRFRFPENVRKHDALIVFSKRSVLQVAAELQKRGKQVSVIYGALPYESRRREVERFIAGETDVVVATDAIGLGMNLPVKRVVFLETEKFDGIEKRPLSEQEIKQIAGRAGRRGIYDVGYYNAEYDKKAIQKKLSARSKPLERVYLDFPDTLLSVEGKLSDLLLQWRRIPDEGVFSKRNLDTEIELAKELELLTLDKELIYSFVTIPFDEKSEYIKPMWKRLFFIESDGIRPDSYMSTFLNAGQITNMSLNDLELEYKRCDLLCNYFRRFRIDSEKVAIMQYKKHISDRISEILATQKLPGRRCRNCGTSLPWNYPHGICEKCYSSRQSQPWSWGW